MKGMVNQYLQIALLASLLMTAPANSIQLGSSADQLESMELLDSRLQDAVEYVEQAFEQFNYRYLHEHNYNKKGKKQRVQNDEGLINLAQVDSFLQEDDEQEAHQKTNLLNKVVPDDNYFVQTNDESKFLGTLVWKVLDFLSFGQLESGS